MLPLKVKKARTGSKTISEKIHEQFAPKSAQDGAEQSDEDETSRPRVSEFDENDDELERTAGGRLSDIRKKNIKYLDAIDRKYQGQVSSRRIVFHYDDEEESVADEEGDEKGESSEDESGYQPGAFVRLKPTEGSDQDEDDFDGEKEEDDDDSDEDEEDEDYSLGDFLGDNRTDSQKLLEDENRQESVQKGVCVQNQLKMWERLLEMRIKMQSSLITANSYPHAEKFNSFCQDKQFKEVTDKVVTTIESTLQNLLELQEILVGRFPESKDVLKSSGSKRKMKNPKSGGKDKVARVDQFESLIRDSYASYKPYRNEVIQKWHDRTKVSSNVKNAHQSLSIVKKIENALFSKDEVIRKTQLYRGGYKLFEEPPQQQQQQQQDDDAEENGESQQIYDEEIFDDSDFYHALLRELIEYKSNTTENPQEIHAKLAELQKLRNKMKKHIDTRASKGRKIRYVVHKKLVNFTAPDDDRRLTDDAKNELFSSLFGGTSS
ncbi:protein Aatf [Ochlerotatus camptorhynchus]|uniref:protein Aatf n=1 Tax=Ochlerotatus camptorhynchus TaxID=644619 RepID=UPI0031D1861B